VAILAPVQDLAPNRRWTSWSIGNLQFKPAINGRIISGGPSWRSTDARPYRAHRTGSAT